MNTILTEYLSALPLSLFIGYKRETFTFQSVLFQRRYLFTIAIRTNFMIMSLSINRTWALCPMYYFINVRSITLKCQMAVSAVVVVTIMHSFFFLEYLSIYMPFWWWSCNINHFYLHLFTEFRQSAMRGRIPHIADNKLNSFLFVEKLQHFASKR